MMQNRVCRIVILGLCLPTFYLGCATIRAEELEQERQASVQVEALLHAAEQIVAEHEFTYNPQRKPEMHALLAIFLAQQDARTALEYANSIPDRLYSAIAKAGIAAEVVDEDLELAVAAYKEAVDSSKEACEFAFEVLPLFPPEPGKELLQYSGDILGLSDYGDGWRSDPEVSEVNDALFALSKATVALAPERVQDLLVKTALMSHHFGESIDLLGSFLARQDMEAALALAAEYYSPETHFKESSSGNTLYCSVLSVLSETDWHRARDIAKRLRGVDREIACSRLAASLLDQGRPIEAEQLYEASLEVAEELGKEPFDNVTFVRALAFRALEAPGQSTQIPYPTLDASPEDVQRMIDAVDPDSRETLDLAEEIFGKRVVNFRDRAQVRAFLEKAPPLAARTIAPGGVHFAGPGLRTHAFGAMTVYASAIGDFQSAFRMAENLTGEFRAYYLLEAYGQACPAPDVVNDWPIYFYAHRPSLNIQN